MKLYSGLLALSSLAGSAVATGPVPVTRTGLAGIAGFYFYNPYCGHGCFRSFSPFTLTCSDTISAGGHTTADQAAHDLAVCRSSDWPYLSSIAWCMNLHCPSDITAALRETFWQTEITGDVNILPKWSYGEVLANITEPPTVVANTSDTTLILNMTMLTTQENFDATWMTLYYFFRETTLESYFSLAIVLTLFGLPIALTWLGYLPFMTRALDRVKPWLYPSIFGTYHDRPLPFLLGNIPTVGQSFYILVAVLLNIILMCVGYKTLYPDGVFQWYTNRYQELLAYWMWRTGALAFADMPLLFLFSTRNNVLLWLTNWSHSTYMLLHRWLARLFLFQVLLHSIISLVLYVDDGYYASTLGTPLWVWGCVATVASVAIILTSFLVFRQRSYELFLITHIVLAVICVVGCWYHVWADDEGDFGYETWLYATIAIWFFDRLARVARMLKTGVRRARVTEIGATLVRVDIPGIRWNAPGKHVYVYFPTLQPLRPWENHPFSTIPTVMLAGPALHGGVGGAGRPDSESNDEEKNNNKTATTVGHRSVSDDRHSGFFTNSGLTLFVRKTKGMTGVLKAHDSLLTLLEGPYPNNPTRSVLQTDRLLLIGGGIGLTGLLPFLPRHPNAKLYHSVRAEDQCLIDNLGPVLSELTEKEILVGSRLAISALLREEASAGWARIGVVVCGPAGMCDDVRAAVAALAREKAGTCAFELEIDAFAW